MPRFAMPTTKTNRSSGSGGASSLVRLNNTSKTTTKDDFILDNSFESHGTDISTDVSNTSELYEARLPRSSSSLSNASSVVTDGSMTGDSLDKIIGQSTTKVATTNKLRGILRGSNGSSSKNSKKDNTPVTLPVNSSIMDPPQIQYQHQQYQQPWIHPVPPNNPTNNMSCYDYSCMPMQQPPMMPTPMPLSGSGMSMPPPGMMPYMMPPMPPHYYYTNGGGMCGGSLTDGNSVKSRSRSASGSNVLGAAHSLSSGYYCAPVSGLPSQYYNCYDYSCGHPDIAAVSVGSTSEGDYSAITSCGGSCAITMCAEPCEGLAEFVRRTVESFAMRGENDVTDYGSLGKGCFSTCGSGNGGETPPTTAEEEVGGGNGTPEKYKKKQQVETEQPQAVGEELMKDKALSKEVDLAESVTINSTADQNTVSSSTSTLGMLSALFGMGTSDTKPQDQLKEDDDDDEDNVDEELIHDTVPEEEAKSSTTNEGDATDPAKDMKSKIKENLLKDHFLDLKKSVDEDDTTDIADTKKLSRRRSKERSIYLPPKVAVTGILKNSMKSAPTTVDSLGFPLSSKSWESDFFAGSNPFITTSTPSNNDIRSIASPTTVAAATLDTPLRSCAWCGGGGTNTKAAQKLKLCSACQSTYYCSADCQSKDWTNGHSVSCGKKE